MLAANRLGYCTAVLLTLAAAVSGQHEPHWLASRNTIVHLFEWKWTDIAAECERFLAPRGFAGVQVSPVAENVVIPGRPWWERYQPVSYKLITRSGNETEFADMVRRCNDVGVRIYVDVLLNHMAATHEGAVYGTGGSVAYPSAKYFPAVPYTEEDFHDTCDIQDWNDRYQVQNCELICLKDLDQSSVRVRTHLLRFLNYLVELGVAGFRVDAAKHIPAEELKLIYDNVVNLNTAHGFPFNARPFIYQEVVDHGYEAVSKYEYSPLGAVTEFRFSEEIGGAFRGHNQLKWLRNWGPAWGFLPSAHAFVFVDNHDNQREGGRVLTYKNAKQYKMATAFTLAYPYGITRVMSSFDFVEHDQAPPADADEVILSPQFDTAGACMNGWVCEHRWRQIYNMIGFKNAVRGTEMSNWWDNDDNQIAFCRGNRGFIAFNGNNWELTQRLYTCLSAGVYCDVISGALVNGKCTGKAVLVDEWGFADIKLGADEFDGVLAIHVQAKMEERKERLERNLIRLLATRACRQCHLYLILKLKCAPCIKIMEEYSVYTLKSKSSDFYLNSRRYFVMK
ncbi:alpha-amylase-related protein [Ceratitis capitata]|uniref:alpha-amylase-related protein n=1 Tax=Ceratitis capitata TaxID=7213 RepID=UPI0003298757|nr:alpha-amylase-related protein [Ceratitis capitata]